MSQPLVNEIPQEQHLLLVLAVTPVTQSVFQHLDAKLGFVFDVALIESAVV